MSCLVQELQNYNNESNEINAHTGYFKALQILKEAGNAKKKKKPISHKDGCLCRCQPDGKLLLINMWIFLCPDMSIVHVKHPVTCD